MAQRLIVEQKVNNIVGIEKAIPLRKLENYW